jgi:hypothetical protein
MDENEQELLESRFTAIIGGIQSFLENDPDKAMNLLNCLK